MTVKFKPESNKSENWEVHFHLAYNKIDQSGLHKETFWKKIVGIHFLKGKAQQ